MSSLYLFLLTWLGGWFLFEETPIVSLSNFVTSRANKKESYLILYYLCGWLRIGSRLSWSIFSHSFRCFFYYSLLFQYFFPFFLIFFFFSLWLENFDSICNKCVCVSYLNFLNLMGWIFLASHFWTSYMWHKINGKRSSWIYLWLWSLATLKVIINYYYILK